MQWFANFVVTADMFSAPTTQAPSLTLPSGAESLAAAPVASVFSSGPSGDLGGGGDGSFAVSELPFTHDVNFDDTPVYTASDDTPWILVSDFSGDGWFYA